MLKEKEREKEKNFMVGFICSWADIKFLLSSLLVICVLGTAFQFIPYKYFLSPNDLRSCLSKLSAPNPPQNLTTQELAKPSKPIEFQQENRTSDLITKRVFNSVGSAAYLFIQMGAYRGGLNTFAVVGLASKPIHVFSKPEFVCEWVPHSNRSAAVTAVSYKMLPDWGYGRVYTVVVVNCTFAVGVGVADGDGDGGQLIVTATSGAGGGGAGIRSEEKFVALDEKPGSVNVTQFTSPPKYDYLYCGSSLYGTLSPQRVREWVAYHVRLFGERSHFVIHDAGGVHSGVMEVLRPWVEKGVVTLQDIRDQERFDGYYHNQFLVVNDCLHRYRYDAKWMFFFDVDEFIYVDPRVKFAGFMDSMSGFTQFTIEQTTISSKLCLVGDAPGIGRMWGLEKLVYKDIKRGIRRDRKYAIQPRNAFSVGVHLSQNFAGKTTHKTEGKIRYFHYHGTIANRREPCVEFVNATNLAYEGTPYYRDDTLRRLAGSVKKFELKSIGKRLMRTTQ